MTIHPDLFWVIVFGVFIASGWLGVATAVLIQKKKGEEVAVLFGLLQLVAMVGFGINLIAGFARGVQ